LLYKDDDKNVQLAVEKAREKAELEADVKDEDNFRHLMWIVRDKDDIHRIQEAMADKVLIIADGHHRYETSLNYQKEILEEIKETKGDESFNYIMMTLFRLDDPGLVILPTYRLIKDLDKLSEEGLKSLLDPYFEISEIDWADTSDKSALVEAQKRVSTKSFTFAAYVAQLKKFLIFQLRSENILESEISENKSKEWKSLDVAILHSLIIDKLEALSSGPFSQENSVSYIRNLDEGVEKVKQGHYQMIFLLKPVSLGQVRDVVENGELMPQKSTDFFPKLKSGLVMNPLGE
jgi:uncharacterized protein (DUF1015 family)